MNPVAVLAEAVVMLGLAVAMVLVCHRLRLPTVVGLLITGIVAGPHGLGVIADAHDVELLAEIGVISLLFTIGLEFSLRRLLELRRAVAIAGPVQMVLTSAAVTLGAVWLGRPWPQAIFLGLLASLSSTAVVLTLLADRAESNTPSGRVGLGILIAQDLAIVPFILVTPLLGGQDARLVDLLSGLALPLLAVVIGVPVLARWVVPWLLALVSRDRQVFLLTTIVLVLGVAWASAALGLSLALGAFLAGLIISESEFGHRAMGSVMPLRDLLTSFFFISVGMLLDVDFVLANPLLVVSATAAIIVIKALATAVATLVIRYPVRTAITAALSLAQMGEFTFILYYVGMEHGLLDDLLGQTVLVVAVLTMMLTPLGMALAPRLAEAALRLPWPSSWRQAGPTAADSAPPVGHLLIVGFGLNGRNVPHAARAAGVPYQIVEMNYETVRRERAAGEPIHHGDATQEAVLAELGAAGARVVVVAISDAAATRQVVDQVRRMNPDAHLIARTRFVSELQPLHDLGADDVIPEEFETSVEIFVHVLQAFLVPQDEIEAVVEQVRQDNYALLRRSPSARPFKTVLRDLPGVDFGAVTVSADSPLAHQTLGDLQLRQRCGVTLLAVHRHDETLTNPSADTRLNPGDRLILLGTPEQIAVVRAGGCSAA